MNHPSVVGIDLGATNVRGGIVQQGHISGILSKKIRSRGTEEEVMQDLFSITDQLVNKDVASIGIGVPSVVGIVYDVQHIPSWVEVPLKQRMEERYHIPVFVNNDANCFALGEFYFGKGQGSTNMIGLTVGTGLGAGIIINKHLYAGPNCGAGEFGMVEYLDHCLEYYCCGQFFQNVYHTDGQLVFERAAAGEAQALQWYAEMGLHLGKTIKVIMYTYDPSLIILGGSVRFAYAYFQQAMWQQIQSFAFTKSISRLQIELSDLTNSGILGAAGLYFDAQ